MFYIAKKGGISTNLQDFYFFNPVIKSYAQYFYITLNTLGFMVAIGRYLFPPFLLLLAIHYSNVLWLKRIRYLTVFVMLPPAFSLLLQHPAVFQYIDNQFEGYFAMISYFSLCWIIGYIILSVVLLIMEALSIQLKLFRSRFMVIIFFILSLLFLYLLYFGQNPIQIYQFYYWGNGIYYMDAVLSVPVYLTIVSINIVLAITGFAGLMKYTKGMYDADKEEIIVQRNNKVVHAGTSVFVHSIKNQLLANRVIIKRLLHELKKETTSEKVHTYTSELSERNELILDRIENLYESVKTQTVHLTPISMREVMSRAMKKFHSKHQHHPIQMHIDDSVEILADLPSLSEAIYNLLTNAQEAILDKGTDEDINIKIKSHQTRQYVVIEIQDEGIGIEKKDMKKITEPFYSTKNSNFNWGMGLFYVHTIVKEHLGFVRYESEKGKGTTFFLFLPKLK